MRDLIRRWLKRQPGKYADKVVDRLRGFGRANVLTAAGMLLALFAHYCVLDRTQPGEAGDQFANSDREPQADSRTSPDGRYDILVGLPVVAAAGTGHEVRSLTLRALGSGSYPSRVLASLQLTGFLEARWSPDSRLVVIVTAPGERTTAATTRVLAVEAEGSPLLALPASVDPAVLLATKDAAAVLQKGGVRFAEWRGDTLRVVSTGHGWVGQPAASDSRQVGIQCLVDLEVSGNRIRELSRDC
jgi:hypothetical protein